MLRVPKGWGTTLSSGAAAGHVPTSRERARRRVLEPEPGGCGQGSCPAAFPGLRTEAGGKGSWLRGVRQTLRAACALHSVRPGVEGLAKTSSKWRRPCTTTWRGAISNTGATRSLAQGKHSVNVGYCPVFHTRVFHRPCGTRPTARRQRPRPPSAQAAKQRLPEPRAD